MQQLILIYLLLGQCQTQFSPAVLPDYCADSEEVCSMAHIDAPSSSNISEIPRSRDDDYPPCVAAMFTQADIYSVLCPRTVLSETKEYTDCLETQPCYSCLKLVDTNLGGTGKDLLAGSVLICHDCRDFELPEEPTGAVCGDDCAVPTSEHFMASLQLAGSLWFSAVAGSIFLFIARKKIFTQETGAISSRIVALNNTVLASIKYNGALIFFCSAYCILYIMRVQKEAVYEYEYNLELIICIALLFFSLLQLVAATITGLEAAITVWFSALIVDALIISSTIGLSSIEVEFENKKTWFSLCFLASIRFLLSAKEEAFRRGLDPDMLTEEELSTLGTGSVFWGSSLLENYPAYDKWGVVTAVYFVCVTVSTVGYGDISPDTVLGRLFTMLCVLSGIIGFSIATHHLAQVYMLNKRGGGSYKGIGSGHIVITAVDMDQRCFAHRAKAFLILPPELMEMDAAEAIREDTENVVRCVSVRRHAWQSHIVIMLLLSEHKELITAAVLPSERIDTICLDTLQLGIIGKNCQIPGFMTIVSNLCKTFGDDDLLLDDCVDEYGNPRAPINWQAEYDRGLSMELYEVILSRAYTNKTFIQVADDIYNRNDKGSVILIGLVEFEEGDGRAGKEVILNPSYHHKIDGEKRVYGVFIAPSVKDEYDDDIEKGKIHRRLDPPPQEIDLEREEIETLVVANLDSEARAEHLNRSLTRGYPVWDSALARKVRSKEQFLKEEGAKEGALEAALNVVRAGKMSLQEAALACGAPLDRLEEIYTDEMADLKESVLAEVSATKPVYDNGESGADRVDGETTFVPPAPEILVKGGHIVFLSVSHIPHVYFVEGNPVSPFDLSRAGVLTAYAIVIHQAPDSSQGGNEGGDGESADNDSGDAGSSGGGLTGFVEDENADISGHMVDADAIFVVKLLEAQLDRAAAAVTDTNRPPRPMIFVELVNGENAKFIPLDPTSAPTRPTDLKGSNYQLGLEVFRSPRYMSGRMFLNSVFSNLCVNILYNTSLLTLVEELIAAPCLSIQISSEWAGRPFHVLYS
ncbi:Calcium-activated potassium channel subunit alpha-1 [Perkinsus chesapeaki]|uniref:Calcium-activated potassium channel subunit alpha-1 n=1 Tax=Perkinsus chesapeaki TaxID=330153 RepID=A0A7J6N0X0_PERCH|nr:Calcium-activated potassium channel subunit alpha-1 [Perkinsus chesapeaki]